MRLIKNIYQILYKIETFIIEILIVKMEIKLVLDDIKHKLYNAGIIIQEMTENEIVMYTFYVSGEEIGNIQMAKSSEDIVEEDIPVIRLRSIYVEDTHRGKGYSKLMIVYGIYMFREKYPEIQFSALDDDSDAALTPLNNLYWKFGYVPKDTYSKKKVLQIYKLCKFKKQTQSEMILDFDSAMMVRFILAL